MTSTTIYLDPGVDMKLLQCSLEVVGLDTDVETGPSKAILSPPTVSRTRFISLFWGQISQAIRLYVTLAPWETLFLWMKKQVLVTWTYPIPWKRHRISLYMPLLHFSL